MKSGEGRRATCRRWKQVLQASHIEAPETEFLVQFVKFGNETSSAVRCEVKVLAQSRRGALTICRTLIKRADRFAVVSQQARIALPA